MGATLAYANYDPQFKEDVDMYVPGFAALADFAADKWVNLVDYVNPKQNASVGLKTEKEKVKMFESLKPKGDPAVKTKVGGVAKQPEAPKTTLKPDVKASQQSSQTGEVTAKDVSGSGGSKVDSIAEKQNVETAPKVKQEMTAKPEVKEPEAAPDIQPETALDIQPEVIPHPPIDLPPEIEEKERVSSAVERQEPESPTEGAGATTTSVEEPAGEETATEVSKTIRSACSLYFQSCFGPGNIIFQVAQLQLHFQYQCKLLANNLHFQYQCKLLAATEQLER